jgi:hypothetical protein
LKSKKGLHQRAGLFCEGYFRGDGGGRNHSGRLKLLLMFTFRKGYCWLGLAILLAEVGIALLVHDAIIRPYVGDFLAVVLVYCFLRGVLSAAVMPLAGLALLVAYAVEAGQYVHLLNLLGLQHSRAARVIFGTSFSSLDILTYTAGFLAIVGIEKLRAAQ